MFAIDWLQKRAELSPQDVALLDWESQRELTYREWNQNTNRLARMLASLGVKQGDRVAIYSMNCVEYLDAFFACGKLGAVLQNLNWRLTTRELTMLLEDASPNVLIYGPDFLEQTEELQANLPDVEHWIALDRQTRKTDLLLSQRDAHEDTDLPDLQLPLETPWVLCYTGGTTGLPKGAILTHRSIFYNAINTVASWGLDAKDCAILNAPLFHVGGLSVFTTPLVYMGGKSILCRSFDVSLTFDLIKDHGVTVFFGVPTMFIMMQEHERWEEADFSKLKFVISGGAPCPLPVFETFWKKEVSFKTGYGLTEAGPNNFCLPAEDVKRKPGSVGFPLMHIKMKLIDNDGNEIHEADQVGQLLLRGPHVMQGYWNKPEATAEAIQDGWLHTGDLAHRDAEGYYYIVGRLKEMFISGGENVYPAEIESILHAHDDIAEAAVFGVPHEKWGEIGIAVIRLTPDATLDVESCKEYCLAHLAKYKVPRKFAFVDDIPKTGAGKIDKKQLKADYS